MRRVLIGCVLVAAALAATAAGYAVANSASGDAAPALAPSSSVVSTITPSTSTTAQSAITSSPDPTRPLPPKPRIVRDPIPYGPRRLAEMAAYAKRHYGVRSHRLHVRLIVLHFTASGAGSYPGVHASFAADTPNNGELPGTCAHFVVDQDGTIYQLVPLSVMCRHAIGVNDRAIGIEMIQATGPSSHWADQQILHRRPQIRSVLRLVRWLQSTYAVPKRDVIGHAMVNDSPIFHDLEGWRNDHTDWQREDVLELRSRL